MAGLVLSAIGVFLLQEKLGYVMANDPPINAITLAEPSKTIEIVLK